MGNPLISLIIPVYNTEFFLRDCLNSIIAQTYIDWEAILVNDGSVDSSGRICDEYSQKDSRFRVIHKRNGGVSSARNTALDVAKGEYICFVDSDDIISPSYLRSLFLALQGVADSSMGGFQHFIEYKEPTLTVIPPNNSINTVETNLKEFYDFKKADWQRYMVNRLFLKKVIDETNLRFREDIFYKEDGLFLVQFLCASNGLVGYTEDIIYFYRQNPSSALGKVRNAFNEKLLTNALATTMIVKELRRKHISSEVISLAKNQAKLGYWWIREKMNMSGIHASKYFFFLEKQLLQTLGFCPYFFWKTSFIMDIIKSKLKRK